MARPNFHQLWDAAYNYSYGICLHEHYNSFTDTSISAVESSNYDAYGIRLVNGSDGNEFYGCTISDLTAGGDIYGVYMDNGSDSNTISKATINSNLKYGVYMTGCSDDFILDSEISDCEYGIHILDKSAHTISGNTICHNFIGIGLYVTWDNKILGNDIRDNDHGVWVDDSYNNTIVRNMIVNNTRGAWDTGVHLTDNTQDNEIHENCFYDNEPQAVDDGTNNDWTGNY